MTHLYVTEWGQQSMQRTCWLYFCRTFMVHVLPQNAPWLRGSPWAVENIQANSRTVSHQVSAQQDFSCDLLSLTETHVMSTYPCRSAQNVPKRIQNNQTPEASVSRTQHVCCWSIGFQLSHKTARILWLAPGIASKWDKPCLTCAGLRSLCVKRVGGMCWLVNSTQVNICWVILCWSLHQGTQSRPAGHLLVVSQCPELKDEQRKSVLFLFFGLLKGGTAQAACLPRWTRAKSGRPDPAPGYRFELWKASKASPKYKVWVQVSNKYGMPHGMKGLQAFL